VEVFSYDKVPGFAVPCHAIEAEL